MNRRDFIKKCFIAALTAGASPVIGKTANILKSQNQNYDLIALKNGTPEAMFDKGIEALGGIGRFVKKGQTVLIKPNMSWASDIESAANTNPKLVSNIIKHCINAGASKVYIIDHILVHNSEKVSGVAESAKSAGAEVYDANSEKYYVEVTVPGAKILKKTKVHKLINETDVFINVPILKSHGGTKLTAALKNLMGVVWDRQFYHRKGLDQCIADFPLYRKPVLNIVDAYRVMVTGGPRGNSGSKIIQPKMQFISTDIVGIDAVSLAQAKAWDLVKGDVPYIKMAYDLSLGEMDINKLNIKKITL